MKPATYNGKGWGFPPEFSLGGQEVMMTEGIPDIVGSLEILLGTRLRERIMQEDYGASLLDFQFEILTPTLITRLKGMISDAILYYEPRINLNEITIDEHQDQQGLLLIRLDFDLPSSNSRYNMVYPFYLTEGNMP